MLQRERFPDRAIYFAVKARREFCRKYLRIDKFFSRFKGRVGRKWPNSLIFSLLSGNYNTRLVRWRLPRQPYIPGISGQLRSLEKGPHFWGFA
jgi:hypothetical protein